MNDTESLYAIVKKETKKKIKLYMVKNDCSNLGEALDKLMEEQEK